MQALEELIVAVAAQTRCPVDRDADYVVCLFAGYVAEKRFDPNAEEGGSSSDNAKAAEVLSRSPDLSERDLREKADILVAKHWREIEAVAVALLEYETLEGDQATLISDCFDEDKDWRTTLATYRNRWKRRLA